MSAEAIAAELIQQEQDELLSTDNLSLPATELRSGTLVNDYPEVPPTTRPTTPPSSSSVRTKERRELLEKILKCVNLMSSKDSTSLKEFQKNHVPCNEIFSRICSTPHRIILKEG